MSRIALDTNAYRLFMEGRPNVVHLIRESDFIGLPVPVIAELRFGFQQGTKGRANEALLQRFMDSPRVEPLNCDLATTHHFAALKSQLKKQGTPIPINDVWIAALVLQHDCQLVSLDQDFKHLPQLAWITP